MRVPRSRSTHTLIAAIFTIATQADAADAEIQALDIDRNIIATNIEYAPQILGKCFRIVTEARLEPVAKEKPCLPPETQPKETKVNASGETITLMSYTYPHISIASSDVIWTQRTVERSFEYNGSNKLADVYKACSALKGEFLYVKSVSIGHGKRSKIKTRSIGERALVEGAELKRKTTKAEAPLGSANSKSNNVVEITIESTAVLCASATEQYLSHLIATNAKLADIEKAYNVYKKATEDEIVRLNKAVEDEKQRNKESDASLRDKDQQINTRDQELKKLSAELSAKDEELRRLRGSSPAPDTNPAKGPGT